MIEEFKVQQRDRLATLCEAAGASQPGVLADSIVLLIEGARVSRRSVGTEGPSANLVRTADAVIASFGVPPRETASPEPKADGKRIARLNGVTALRSASRRQPRAGGRHGRSDEDLSRHLPWIAWRDGGVAEQVRIRAQGAAGQGHGGMGRLGREAQGSDRQSRRPLGKTKRVSAAGVADVRNAMAVYMVVRAELARGGGADVRRPSHFTMFPGEAIEVMERLPIPGR